MQIIFQCKPYEKPASEGSDTEFESIACPSPTVKMLLANHAGSQAGTGPTSHGTALTANTNKLH